VKKLGDLKESGLRSKGCIGEQQLPQGILPQGGLTRGVPCPAQPFLPSVLSALVSAGNQSLTCPLEVILG
jgi:hypothetical protein